MSRKLHFMQLVRWFCVVLMLLQVAACARTATGVKRSVYQAVESQQFLDGSTSIADAAVIIRYPAMVDRGAEVAFFDAFLQRPIGGKVTDPAPESDRIAESLIIKSNYFAMSLYRELRNALPGQTVLLSPHVIRLNEQGELESVPMLSAEQVPSVLTIDFSVYSFPAADKMMDAPPLTFGDLVTPLLVVHANRWLLPATHGLLLASEPLLQTAWQQSYAQAEAQFEQRLTGAQVDHQRSLDFVRYLAGKDGSTAGKRLDLPTRSAGRAREQVSAVEVYPLEKIRLPYDEVLRLPHRADPDPFAQEFVRGAADRVVAVLNQIDHDRATFFKRQSALKAFDPELANAFFLRTPDLAVRARIRLAESLLEAERTFLARQAEAIYAGAYEGSYGQQMRELLASELRILEERREMARAQNIRTVLAIAAMAGAIYAGVEAGDASSYGSYTGWELASAALALTSIWAVNSAMNINSASDAVGETFLLQMAPALEQQISVQVELLDSSEQITASTFADFRLKTRELYQRSARSLQIETPSNCRFVVPGSGAQGTWYGDCQDEPSEGQLVGTGYGTGYGVLRAADGRALEYLGEVHQGMPHGLGALIERPSDMLGAFYSEGNFDAGRPQGILRVEQPGRRAESRRFKDGKDVGSAGDALPPRLRYE